MSMSQLDQPQEMTQGDDQSMILREEFDAIKALGFRVRYGSLETGRLAPTTLQIEEHIFSHCLMNHNGVLAAQVTGDSGSVFEVAPSAFLSNDRIRTFPYISHGECYFVFPQSDADRQLITGMSEARRLETGALIPWPAFESDSGSFRANSRRYRCGREFVAAIKELHSSAREVDGTIASTDLNESPNGGSSEENDRALIADEFPTDPEWRAIGFQGCEPPAGRVFVFYPQDLPLEFARQCRDRFSTLVYGSDGIIYSAIAVSSDVSIHDFSSALTVEMTEASDSDLVGFSWYRSGQSEWSELNDQVPRIIGERGEASRRLEEPRRALSNIGLPCEALSNIGLPCEALDNIGLPCEALDNIGLPCEALDNTGLPCEALDNTGLPCEALDNTGLPCEALDNTVADEQGSLHASEQAIDSKKTRKREKRLAKNNSPKIDKSVTENTPSLSNLGKSKIKAAWRKDLTKRLRKVAKSLISDFGNDLAFRNDRGIKQDPKRDLADYLTVAIIHSDPWSTRPRKSKEAWLDSQTEEVLRLGRFIRLAFSGYDPSTPGRGLDATRFYEIVDEWLKFHRAGGSNTERRRKIESGEVEQLSILLGENREKVLLKLRYSIEGVKRDTNASQTIAFIDSREVGLVLESRDTCVFGASAKNCMTMMRVHRACDYHAEGSPYALPRAFVESLTGLGKDAIDGANRALKSAGVIDLHGSFEQGERAQEYIYIWSDSFQNTKRSEG